MEYEFQNLAQQQYEAAALNRYEVNIELFEKYFKKVGHHEAAALLTLSDVIQFYLAPDPKPEPEPEPEPPKKQKGSKVTVFSNEPAK